MDAYAVIETGGKQYRVRAGDVVNVELLGAEAGGTVTLDRVLAVSNGTELTVGTPAVAGATVTAAVLQEGLKAKKVVAFRKKRRKGYHKKRGHRQRQTQLRIESINA
jgi:large subunit ribosomal protein L21